MGHWLQVVVLVLAFFAGATAFVAQRQPGASPSTRVMSRGSILLSLAIIIGTAPGLLFRSMPGFTLACWIISIGLTLLSLILTGRGWRRRHSTA